MNDPIIVNGNIVPAALFTLLRQIVLTASGYFLGKGSLDGEVAEAAAWVLVFAGTLAYGQIKGWLERRELIAVAEAAPDSVAVVQ
jgi:hypothetical protein